MLASVRKWFSGRETETKTVPLHAPDSSRDLARSAKPTEPQRIRWVNEDVSRQHIPGQIPDQNPVSKPGNAIRPGVAPNASTEVTNSPRTMAEQQAQKRVSTGYDVTASSEDGNGAPRTYGAAGVNKPRSAPVVRNNGVTGPNVRGFRAQSAGASKGKRFVQPSSEFSLHGTPSRTSDGDLPLASSTFPFKTGGGGGGGVLAGPIDPLGPVSFSQTQHSRVDLDPFTDSGKDGPSGA